MAISKLKSDELYKKCDPHKFEFTTTAELEERLSALGQDRALSAVELGINIKSKGYNLFCLGPEGTGKTSLVKRILVKEAKERPTPQDWVYVYNFEEPHKPIAISFAAGDAPEFAKDIDKLIEEFSSSIPAVLDSDEYKAALSIIREKYKQKKEEYIRLLQKKAKGKSVSLLHMPVGLVVAPVKNGEVLSPEAFDELPEDEKKSLIDDLNMMQEEIENRTVTLIISAVKLTARELKAGMDKYLSEKKSKAMEKARAAPEKPSGKQTVRQLIGQNQGVSNIEITNSNIKGFERIARKYGVDFAVKKDRSVSPPKYFVFFKARDADALTAAFKEYTAYELKRAAKAQNRPSVLAHLQALKAKVQAITPGKSRNQNRGITI